MDDQKRGRLNIRPELALRPLLYLAEECPADLIKVRGREETKKWSRNWQLINKLGNQPDGSMINMLRCKVTSTRVHARSFPKEILRKGGIMRILRMVEIKSRCQEHTGVSALYAVIEDEYGVTMFYEPEKMDLYNFMTERQKELTEKYAVQKIIQPLVETLEYLHTSQAVVHRNLTAESVIFDLDGHIKVGDFSLALCLNDQSPSSVVGSKMSYMAPELLQLLVMQQMRNSDELPPNPYDERIDIWSLGVLFYELFMDREPYYGRDPETMLEAIDRGAHFKTPKAAKLSQECRDFIDYILNPEPSERPSASEILEHEFIRMHQEAPKVTGLAKARSATRKLLAAATVSFRDRPGSAGGSSILRGGGGEKTPTSFRGGGGFTNLGLEDEEPGAQDAGQSEGGPSSSGRPRLQAQRSLMQMFVVTPKKSKSKSRISTAPEGSAALQTVEETAEETLTSFRASNGVRRGDSTRRSTGHNLALPPPIAPPAGFMVPEHLAVTSDGPRPAEEGAATQAEDVMLEDAESAAPSHAAAPGFTTPIVKRSETPGLSSAVLVPGGGSPAKLTNRGQLAAPTPASPPPPPPLRRQTTLKSEKPQTKTVCGCFNVVVKPGPNARPATKYETE